MRAIYTCALRNSVLITRSHRLHTANIGSDMSPQVKLLYDTAGQPHDARAFVQSNIEPNTCRRLALFEQVTNQNREPGRNAAGLIVKSLHTGLSSYGREKGLPDERVHHSKAPSAFGHDNNIRVRQRKHKQCPVATVANCCTQNCGCVSGDVF